MSTAKTREERFWAKVNITPNCWLWVGAHLPKGYGLFGSERERLAHRIAYAMEHGPIPEGMQVDHTCHQAACVNVSHLRLVTPKQNMENIKRKQTAGTRLHKASGRWIAEVSHHNRPVHAGYYATQAEAAEAARLKRIELYTHNDLDRH